MFKIEAWYALHEGGTKFYHVVRVISPNGTSFAMAHYGAKNAFVGMGKITAGQTEVCEVVSTGTKAGTAKIRQKNKAGEYTISPITENFSAATLAELKTWIKTNFNDKARNLAYAEINKPIFFSGTTADPDADDRIAQLAALKDEPGTKQHDEWATW